MIVDTIVKIDTVFDEKASDMISQNEMLNQIGTMHNMYSDNFSNLVIIVSVIAGIIGVFLPVLLLIIQNRSNKKEINRLKIELKEEVEKEYDEKLDKIVKELKADFNLELNNAKQYSEAMIEFNVAVIMLINDDERKAIWFFIRAARYVIKDNNYITLNAITANLSKIKDMTIRYRKNEFTMFNDIDYNGFIDEVKSSKMMNTSARRYVEEFLQKVHDFVY